MAKHTISVIERRLQGPDVFRTSSQPIPLKTGTWVVRWINATISTDRLWDVLHNKGWVYALPEDLACDVDEIGAHLRDGRIVRGTRGDEVLMKMPASAYKRLEKRKADENARQTFGKKQLKDAIVSGVSTEHGDEAATYVHKHMDGITVKDGRGPEDTA